MVLLATGQQFLLDAPGVYVVKDLIGHDGVFVHDALGFPQFPGGKVAYSDVSDLADVYQFFHRLHCLGDWNAVVRPVNLV